MPPTDSSEGMKEALGNKWSFFRRHRHLGLTLLTNPLPAGRRAYSYTTTPRLALITFVKIVHLPAVGTPRIKRDLVNSFPEFRILAPPFEFFTSMRTFAGRALPVPLISLKLISPLHPRPNIY